MIPWFEWPYIFDVRARPNVIQSTSGSKDLQMVRKQPDGTVFTLRRRSLRVYAVFCHNQMQYAHQDADSRLSS